MNAEKKLAGIWVDHMNAWIVRYDRGAESMVKVESLMKPSVKATGGSKLAPVSHHKIDGRRHELAKKFYKKIISQIGEVDEFFLMGPSNAKSELKNCILKMKPLAAKLKESVTADHLTEPQIAARVREYFGLGNAPLSGGRPRASG